MVIIMLKGKQVYTLNKIDKQKRNTYYIWRTKDADYNGSSRKEKTSYYG